MRSTEEKAILESMKSRRGSIESGEGGCGGESWVRPVLVRMNAGGAENGFGGQVQDAQFTFS